MIRLGLRFALRGGGEAQARLAFTALGVAVAVGLLLFTLSGFNGLAAKDVRQAWLSTSNQNRQPSVDESTSDPLWWRLSFDTYEGQTITVVEVAAMGARSPVLPGLQKMPGAGQYYVSPALARLLASTPADVLGERFPGRKVGVVGNPGLTSPSSLVAVIGRTPAELQTGVLIRSIESAPRPHDYSEFFRIALGIGAIGLMIPVLVFVMTSTRLAAARREERLAALRLVGATPRQVNLIASIEAALAAALGTAVGFGLFFIFRPLVARIPFTGDPFFPGDLSLGWVAVSGVAVGVPVAAVVAGVLALRRVQISPLGVTRKALRRPPKAIRLVVPVVGLGLLLVPSLVRNSQARTLIVFVVFAFISLGIVVAGPWLTLMGARLLARGARRDSTLIAARRLSGDPRRAFRAISGLILAVFVGTVFVGIVGTAVQNGAGSFHPRSFAGGTLIQSFDGTETGSLAAAEAAPTLERIGGLSGVSGVIEVSAPAQQPTDGEMVGVMSGADWATLNGEDKASAAGEPVTVNLNAVRQGYLERAPEASAVATGGVQLLTVLVFTDGQAPSVERARTALEVGLSTLTPAYSVAELSANTNPQLRTLERMVEVGIILSLIIAGCSLAVSVAGGLVERKRAFTLLRLTGMPLSSLYKAVLLEAAAPLLLAAAISAGAGFLVAGLVTWNTGGGIFVAAPGLAYYALMVGGLLAALAVVGVTMPLLGKVTEPRVARME